MEIKKKVNIKGGSILDSINYINEKFSKADIENAKQALSASDRAALFERTIMSISLVTFESVINYMTMLDKQTGKSDLALLKEIAQVTSARNFKGIYKIFMSLLSPQRIINKVPNIWKQQLDQGDCRVIWESEHEGNIEVTNWEAPRNHELLQIPYYIKALTIAGGKNANVTHPECIARGDEACIFHYEFE